MSCAAHNGPHYYVYRKGGTQKAKTQWNPMVVFGITLAASFGMLAVVAMIAIISYIAMPMPSIVAVNLVDAPKSANQSPAVVMPSLPFSTKVSLEIRDLKVAIENGQVAWNFSLKNTGNVPVALDPYRPFKTTIDGREWGNGGEDPASKSINGQFIQPGQERKCWTTCGIYNSALDRKGPAREKNEYATQICVVYQQAEKDREGFAKLIGPVREVSQDAPVVRRTNRLALR